MPVKQLSETHIVLGVMSGTSLDGLDLALVHFNNNEPGFDLIGCSTAPYPESIQTKLRSAITFSALELAQLDVELGNYFGEKICEFLKKHKGCQPNIISSHGHTIFHQPNNGLTLQIGSGQHIASKSQIPTVCDFRTKDVALGGQGAPLVPIGDLLLFPNYKHCINIGGISNISTKVDGEITTAYDICVGNLALNHMARKEGFTYDKDGIRAQSGNILPALLSKLNALPYLSKQPPKSLGYEDIKHDILSILESCQEANADILRTLVEHIAIQITYHINGKALLTGGGAHNTFLVKRLKEMSPHEIFVPNREIIDYKEAVIFALLGALYMEGETNVLSVVTGSKRDHTAGILYTP